MQQREIAELRTQLTPKQQALAAPLDLGTPLDGLRLLFEPRHRAAERPLGRPRPLEGELGLATEPPGDEGRMKEGLRAFPSVDGEEGSSPRLLLPRARGRGAEGDEAREDERRRGPEPAPSREERGGGEENERGGEQEWRGGERERRGEESDEKGAEEGEGRMSRPDAGGEGDR